MEIGAEMDRLGDEIAELSAHLEAATARLLELIAARERVRVARALGSLPRLAEALSRGELSYAKVRALTRVAPPEIEERLLAVGRAGTACHVECIVRGWRRVDQLAERCETTQRQKSRALHVYQDEDGMVVIRGRLTPEAGAVLMQALAAARETLYQRTRGTDAPGSLENVSAETPSMAQLQADALALLAETALHHDLDPGAPGERYQVVVHVDAPVLADPEAPGQSVLEGGTHVSAETSRRLACDATRVVMRHDPDGRIVEVGARTRTIPPALRRALHHRDRGCQWPRGDPPRSRTSRYCVGTITAPSTRRDTGWNGSPTANCDSGDRTEDLCRTSRFHRRFPTIPFMRFARGTRRLAFAWTRARRAPPGWANASTWVGQSTSCTLGPSSPWRSLTRPGEPGRGRPHRFRAISRRHPMLRRRS